MSAGKDDTNGNNHMMNVDDADTGGDRMETSLSYRSLTSGGATAVVSVGESAVSSVHRQVTAWGLPPTLA